MLPIRNTGGSWMRVAMGLEKVIKALAEQKVDTSAIILIPSIHHIPDLLSSYQIAIQQVTTTATKRTAAMATKASTTGGGFPSCTSASKSGTEFQSNSSSAQPLQPTFNSVDPSFDAQSAAPPAPFAIKVEEISVQSQVFPGALASTPIFKNDSVSQSASNTSTRTTNTIPIGDDTIDENSNILLDSFKERYHSLHQDSEPVIDDMHGAITQQKEPLRHDKHHSMKEGTAVPSTRAGRALGFANLGLGLLMGTVTESARRFLRSEPTSSTSAILNDTNSDRVAASLCRMRGAALKMGQMLSIQDESLLPPALSRALQQVRQGADAMPRYQLEQQLIAQLGSNWSSKFVHFDMQAFAAASIGQVHRATIRNVLNNRVIIQPVVVKVQYPGVAQSIESDLHNLTMLVKWSGLAPKGLFIENVIRVGRDELKVECDYRRELRNQHRMKVLVESDPILVDNCFRVPESFDDLTTDEVITSEYVPGGTIDKIAKLASQQERNRIGRTILYLTMKELFDWRFMQTDPNWGNFLYDFGTRTTGLIDFGATREYSKSFVDGYLRIVWASANRDETTLMEQSHIMGFLTGKENTAMLRAHKLSGYTVGEPFRNDESFDFRSSRISERMGEHTSVFLQHRLTAPPEEVYTLHRKLAGAYMLCIKLDAIVESPRAMLESIVLNHTFDDGKANPITGQ
jgi:aarF domain-containing kinase